MLHAYCGGLELTPATHRLNSYSRRCKSFLPYLFLPVVSLSSLCLTPVLFPIVEMEATKQRALVRASATTHKKDDKEEGKEGASSSAPKVIGKGAPKRKAEGKDDRPLKI